MRTWACARTERPDLRTRREVPGRVGKGERPARCGGSWARGARGRRCREELSASALFMQCRKRVSKRLESVGVTLAVCYFLIFSWFNANFPIPDSNCKFNFQISTDLHRVADGLTIGAYLHSLLLINSTWLRFQVCIDLFHVPTGLTVTDCLYAGIMVQFTRIQSVYISYLT